MKMAVIIQFREHWRDLCRGRPGRRFQARYERSKQEEARSHPVKRILLICLAIVFLAIAIVLMVMPGPAFVFFILAGALIATESKGVARFMDWAEVRVRSVLAWCKWRWRAWSKAGRAVAVGVALMCTAGFAYGAYRYFLG
jgi:uncharacterized membrane protein YbaN (DUF454 family)